MPEDARQEGISSGDIVLWCLAAFMALALFLAAPKLGRKGTFVVLVLMVACLIHPISRLPVVKTATRPYIKTAWFVGLLLLAVVGIAVFGYYVWPESERATLHVTKEEVLLGPLPTAEVTDVYAKIYFKDTGKLPIERLRYGFRFQLSKETLSWIEEDALWDGLIDAGATQKMTDSETPVDTEQYVKMNVHWNHPEMLRQVSQGNGFMYVMVYLTYEDGKGSHQTEYCGVYHWQPSDVPSCYHHNREN